MAPKLQVHTQGPIGSWVDKRLEWLMRFVSGFPLEAPQRTHRWNNHHLKQGEVTQLLERWMVSHEGDSDARQFPGAGIFDGALVHLTKYGGWKRYLVLASEIESPWHVGWCLSSKVGVSRIPTEGPVRVLLGKDPVRFFGIEAFTNLQVPIKQIGEGCIGDGGLFSQVPLF